MTKHLTGKAGRAWKKADTGSILPGVFLLVFMLFPLQGAEGIVYRSASGVSLKESTVLRRFETLLREFFPRSPLPRTALTIDITGKGTPPAPAGGNVLEVNCFKLARYDLETLSDAGGAILHAYGKAPAGFRVPLFFCAAFRHRERSLKKEACFLGNNRRLVPVEVFLRNGTMPPLELLLTASSPDDDPALAEWYDNCGRFLLELLRGRGFKGTPVELMGAAEKFLASEPDKEKVQTLVWNNFNLCPPEILEKEMQLLRQVTLPQLDHQGELTSLSETVPVTAMPGKLQEHPERALLCRKYAADVLKCAGRFPFAMRSPLRALHTSVIALSKDPRADRPFLQAVAEVEKSFDLFKKRSQTLDLFALAPAAPVRLWRNVLRENSRKGTLLPPEAERFLDRAEEYYNNH
jgi:hypothetical protein